jgi:hypothetical protein
MRESGLIISGRNRGFKSPMADDNHGKPRLNGRSKSDIIFLCKLYRLYLAVFAVKKWSKSKLFEGYFLEAFFPVLWALLLHQGVS